ncbi:MAG: UDP-glucose/GDP-mannose dehydrogenase family protein [Alicyclobacillus sp.]|nr:UDP-glucose/GDP-mannose dehydrogenase family protein [Alicyclobacillus sp.]
MTKQVAVMGLGYVGLATSLTLAHLGHTVVGFDPDVHKVQSLSRGRVPFYEDGFLDLLESGIHSDRLAFTNDPEYALSDVDFVFICVGTPSLANGQADLSQVRSAARMIGRYMNRPVIVVDKSTVPVGTGDMVERWVREAQSKPLGVDVVSNPEFLREGSAVRDALQPARIVIGSESSEAGEAVGNLFAELKAPILFYDRRTAEMVKYASNAFLATKISFINEIAAICERVGADVTHVAEGMGYDPRIGPQFLRAGVGYGGSCFPKDTAALIQIAGNVYYDFKLLKAVVDVNNQARLRVVQILEDALDGLSGKIIAVLGLSFKPHTDDIRESPALTIIPALIDRGAKVKATDPAALERAKSWFSSLGTAAMVVGQCQHGALDTAASVEGSAESYELSFVADALSAVVGADAVLLLTEWPQFISLDWGGVAERMSGIVVVDGRNSLRPNDVKTAGLKYMCIGRPGSSR